MEDVEIGIFDSSVIEVRGREGSSVKGSGVLLITFMMNTNKISAFVDTPVADVLGSFCLSFLVKEDNGIEMRLSTVILYPPFARVIRVLKVASEWWSKMDRLGRRSGSSDGRLVLSEVNRFITVDTVVIHVRFGEVKNTRDEE